MGFVRGGLNVGGVRAAVVVDGQAYDQGMLGDFLGKRSSWRSSFHACRNDREGLHGGRLFCLHESKRGRFLVASRAECSEFVRFVLTTGLLPRHQNTGRTKSKPGLPGLTFSLALMVLRLMGFRPYMSCFIFAFFPRSFVDHHSGDKLVCGGGSSASRLLLRIKS